MSPSPRSSLDAAHRPHSPFLHNLSHRLRKGSAASHASSQSSDTNHSADRASSRDNLDHIQDALSARQHVKSITRNDWEYPPPINDRQKVQPTREPVAYNLRDESASDYEDPDRKNSHHLKDDPYRFDDPEDVGRMMDRRRKRKRKILEDELTWNEGLRNWSLQRDVWTGALTHKPRSKSPDSARPRGSRTLRHSRNGSDYTRASPEPSGSPTRHRDAQAQFALKDESTIHGPYLPIYAPLLPASNILRARIKPQAYPTIYSKVAVQGLAPNVPIPLRHMIGALVVGWKSEGNWPPQATAAENDQGQLKSGKRNKSESAFARWKREQEEGKRQILQDTPGAGRARPETELVQEEEEEQQQSKRGMRRVLKKVIGLEHGDKSEKELQKIGLIFETDEDALGEAEPGNGIVP